MARIRVALAQLNLTVGDLQGNAQAILGAYRDAADQGCDVVAFPELATVGYPPEDLLLKEGFVDAAAATLAGVAAASPGCLGLIGAVLPADADLVEVGAPADARDVPAATAPRRHLANTAAITGAGRLHAAVAKRELPNYAVFDEQRWFVPGTGPAQTFAVAGASVGVVVCEDAWVPGPCAQLAAAGAGLIVVLNASPFSRRRLASREAVIAQRATETGCAIAYVNLVGGQDELVFDGASFVVDGDGSLVATAPQFTEHLLVVDLDVPDAKPGARTLDGIRAAAYDHGERRASGIAEPLDELAEVYGALVCGTRDYLAKNGFARALIALSGGIDSSLVAAIAVDAIGPAAVTGLSMPSRYSSSHSRTDAAELARRLGIELVTAPIEASHVALADALAGVLGAEPSGLTDENLQSRIRGLLLMGLSNATGAIVLTTGNKSELATGYSTLYGDTAGGFAVIKDVVKTLVFELCRHRNEVATKRGEEPPIPESVLIKPPSAELRADQRDDDSLPPYELLDPVLEAYVEDDRTATQLAELGYDPALVQRVVALVDAAEYKRRQMPPGVRITTKSFGRDRRVPITNRFGAAQST